MGDTGMAAGAGGARKWLRRLAATAFLVSFLLPAVRLGGPREGWAVGLLAAPLSAYVLPLALRAAPAAGRSAEEWLFMVVSGVFFGLLFLQNFVMLYGLRAAAGDLNRARRAWRLAALAALLALAVPLVDFPRLYAGLGLVHGEAVRLGPGYYLWAGSFVLLAASLRPRRTPTS